MNPFQYLQKLAPLGVAALGAVAATGIATAPAQAGTLGWSNGTSDFFSQVDFTDTSDTFSVTFSPDNITLISTANDEFLPEFAPAPAPYAATTTATGNFSFVGPGSGIGEFIYELASPLSFLFPDPGEGSGAAVTWATGTKFIGLADTLNSVEFELAANQPLPTVTGVVEIPPSFVIDDVLEFGDGVLPAGGVYAAEVEVANGVPEPASVLGLLTFAGLGLRMKRKQQA